VKRNEGKRKGEELIDEMGKAGNVLEGERIGNMWYQATMLVIMFKARRERIGAKPHPQIRLVKVIKLIRGFYTEEMKRPTFCSEVGECIWKE
jgi:hypothetical protein